MPETATSPLSDLELAVRQLEAIDAFHARRRAAEATAAGASREERMDLARRLEVLATQHAAVVTRTEQQLLGSADVLHLAVPARALVAHRNAWFTGKVCAELRQHGVEVVACVDNGAEAVGIAVAEQPDLVLVEDLLVMLPGEEVVREVRRYVPGAVVVAQVAYGDRVGTMLDAGADSAHTRQVPPADVVADLLGLRTRVLQDA